MMNKTGESKNVEWKREIPKNHENILKDIIAFSNSTGGKLYIGIEDGTGIVYGIGDKNPFRMSDDLTNMISASCTPQIETEISVVSMEGKTVLVVDVPAGRFRPYYLKSKGKESSSFVRINGTSRIADEGKLKELELEGERVSYDSLKEIGMEYDEEKALNLCKKMKQRALANCKTDEERNAVKDMTIDKLVDFGVLGKSGNALFPTHAFDLLCDNHNRSARIQCALFKGTTRSIFVDKKEFTGPIDDQLEEAYQFVLRHTNLGAVINGLYRDEAYSLPVSAIREMIANAVIHRSYVNRSCIQVSMYDDRIEVDSPGTLFGGMDIETAKSGRSMCRNEAIAQAFQYMKTVETWGTGIPRIFESCKEYGLPEPEFEESGNGFKAILYKGADQEPKGANREPKGAELMCAYEKKRIIIEILEKNPETTQNELMEILSLSRKQVQLEMKSLQEDGLLSRIGSNRKGRWVVTKNIKNS